MVGFGRASLMRMFDFHSHKHNPSSNISFQRAFLTRTMSGHKQAPVGQSIDEATLTFVRTIMESTTQPHPSQALALNAFTTAFQQWNPQTMSDVTVTDRATLDLLFAPTSVLPRYDQAFMDTLQKHRNMIGVLVQKFNDSLSSRQLNVAELRAACAAIDSQVWDSYKLYNEQQEKSLPSKTTSSSLTASADSGIAFGDVPTTPSTVPANSGFAIEGASTPFHRATSSGSNQQQFILDSRTFSSNSPQVLPLLPSIPTILLEIDKLVEIDKLERLRETIDRYNHVCIRGKSYSLADCGEHDIKIDDSEKRSSSTMQTLLRTIQERVSDPNYLYWYMYFRLHPSKLLGEISSFSYSSMPIANFNLHAQCKPIRDAFGADMNYAGVGTALELCKDNYNAEIKVLLNCEILKISALDVANFRAVKLLHEISKPLQDAIHCCVLHQFELVTSDPSFGAFQTMVNEFYSTASHGRESCLDFLNRLHSKLCAANVNDSNNAIATSLRKVKQLQLSIDALLPLQYALHGLKLRNFFRTMDWLTVDYRLGSSTGLRKFYRDDEALRSLLRVNDATELMIVDSLMPVVQMFSYLEPHCMNSQSVHCLVSGLRTDQDMVAQWRAPMTLQTIQADVHDLNSRIYAIEELFQAIAP